MLSKCLLEKRIMLYLCFPTMDFVMKLQWNFVLNNFDKFYLKKKKIRLLKLNVVENVTK